MSNALFGTVIGYMLGILIIFCIAKILFAPLKVIVRIIFNSLLGAAVLAIINCLSPFLHIYIGVNAITALMLGILGVPGLCMLMLLKVFF